MQAHNDPPVAHLKEEVHRTLRNWFTNRPQHTFLEDLLLTRQIAAADHGDVRLAVSQVLWNAMQTLRLENPRHADILQFHYMDSLQVAEIAHRLSLSIASVNKEQAKAIVRLTEIIQHQEAEAGTAQRRRLIQRLPTPAYTTLIGATDALGEMQPLLAANDSPWLLGIEGIGGIGKTALARTLTERCINAGLFTDVAWLTARQEYLDLGGGLTPLGRPVLTTNDLVQELLAQLTADDAMLTSLSSEQQLSLLAERLHAQPHLIVIDNLKGIDNAEELLSLIRRLANPTKFLLTTRNRYQTEPGVYYFPLRELSAADTLALVRQEAAERNLPHLLAASDDELKAIYAAVGGNPLAIRLVVGQMHMHDLDWILDDLATARGQTVENLYTYIYRRAWDALDEAARLVWLHMPRLPASNANVQMLATLTERDVHTARHALATLVKLNLVNAQGPLNARTFSIHNLTRSFLLEGVAQWSPKVSYTRDATQARSAEPNAKPQI